MFNSTEMTQEEFEFYEDMIFMAEQAAKEEVLQVIDSEWVITHSGEIKLNPSFELKKYIDCRNQQKRELQIQKFRKENFKLIK